MIILIHGMDVIYRIEVYVWALPKHGPPTTQYPLNMVYPLPTKYDLPSTHYPSSYGPRPTPTWGAWAWKVDDDRQTA